MQSFCTDVIVLLMSFSPISSRCRNLPLLFVLRLGAVGSLPLIAHILVSVIFIYSYYIRRGVVSHTYGDAVAHRDRVSVRDYPPAIPRPPEYCLSHTLLLSSLLDVLLQTCALQERDRQCRTLSLTAQTSCCTDGTSGLLLRLFS